MNRIWIITKDPGGYEHIDNMLFNLFQSNAHPAFAWIFTCGQYGDCPFPFPFSSNYQLAWLYETGQKLKLIDIWNFPPTQEQVISKLNELANANLYSIVPYSNLELPNWNLETGPITDEDLTDGTGSNNGGSGSGGGGIIPSGNPGGPLLSLGLFNLPGNMPAWVWLILAAYSGYKSARARTKWPWLTLAAVAAGNWVNAKRK
ncbi:MAG: hypothetical protein D6816_13045 [Bacteroidetes bacterium]|nr:MAG: hypothetical protein D6816_13045 [Bacteroidota bacterium]